MIFTEDITVYDLCNDYKTALRFGFAGTNYILGISVEPGKLVNSRRGYDVDSVMHYNSGQGNGDPRCPWLAGAAVCPLAFWNDPEDHQKGYYARTWLNAISPGDVQWVKDIYPWDLPNPSS